MIAVLNTSSCVLSVRRDVTGIIWHGIQSRTAVAGGDPSRSMIHSRRKLLLSRAAVEHLTHSTTITTSGPFCHFIFNHIKPGLEEERGRKEGWERERKRKKCERNRKCQIHFIWIRESIRRGCHQNLTEREWEREKKKRKRRSGDIPCKHDDDDRVSKRTTGATNVHQLRHQSHHHQSLS